jgi:hypothetical protein
MSNDSLPDGLAELVEDIVKLERLAKKAETSSAVVKTLGPECNLCKTEFEVGEKQLSVCVSCWRTLSQIQTSFTNIHETVKKYEETAKYVEAKRAIDLELYCGRCGHRFGEICELGHRNKLEEYMRLCDRLEAANKILIKAITVAYHGIVLSDLRVEVIEQVETATQILKTGN